MDLALWVGQCSLAVMFAVSGSVKLTQSKQRMLDTGQTGVAPFPLPVIRVVAAAELLAVPGLILPWATGVAPVLTPLAAAGLIVFMVGAAWSHARLRELKAVVINLALLGVAAFVLVGRLTAA